MREIKFRAKLAYDYGKLNKGEWVYFNIKDSYIYDKWLDWSTLCQFISQSKYNVDIYENDIAKTRLGQIAIIQYFDVAHTYGYKVVKPVGKYIWVENFDLNCHIIGNIFDNPEYSIIEEK